MGNRTQVSFFKTKERLRFIEQTAFWRGTVNRQDIAGEFGLSMAQASADLQAYQAANPGALVYDLSAKCYTWGSKAKPALHRPDFAEAVALFGDGETAASALVPVARFMLPARTASLAVQQAIFQAVLAGEGVRVVYYSIDSGAAQERRIAPRAFGFDGFRWHVRAWCFEHDEYRDFVLGRIEKVAGAEVLSEAPPPDEAWEREVTLVIQPNPKLKATMRRSLEMDFGMTDGVLQVTVREALAFYARVQFESLWSPKEKATWFVVSQVKL